MGGGSSHPGAVEASELDERPSRRSFLQPFAMTREDCDTTGVVLKEGMKSKHHGLKWF